MESACPISGKKKVVIQKCCIKIETLNYKRFKFHPV